MAPCSEVGWACEMSTFIYNDSLTAKNAKKNFNQTGLQACPGAMRLNSVDKITLALCV